MSKTIVAFGDSNTRYWLGDMGEPGRLRDAWPAQLEALLNACGVPAHVKNEGYPGEQMDFALQQFENFVKGADLCVLNFGTNDAKKPEISLEFYLSEMRTLLDQAAECGVPAVVLGIPWFDEALAGAEMQARLPLWNQQLQALCEEKGAPFVDLYGPSEEDPEGWFNEIEAPKRHLSCVAQRQVAEMVLPHALKLFR